MVQRKALKWIIEGKDSLDTYDHDQITAVTEDKYCVNLTLF